MGIRGIRTRTSLVVGLLAAVLLILCWAWLDRASSSLVNQAEDERAITTARSLEASLRSIMLTGNANIAHDWITRVSGLPDVIGARIYRTDGDEAFVDQKTRQAVNRWLGESRFPVQQRQQGTPGAIPADLAGAFKSVADSSKPWLRRDSKGKLTLLYPIRVEPACLQCHGYDKHINRGVLALSISTVQAGSLIASLKEQALMVFFAMTALLVLGVWMYSHRAIFAPITRFAETARRIGAGNRLLRFDAERKDELGELAACSNSLLDQLEEEINTEQRLRMRQQGLVDATISLSSKEVTHDLLTRVGELAMQMTGAKYAMLSHLDRDDKMQFIPLGISKEDEARIGHLPEGKGLLGLLWNEGQVVRTDHIASHPESSGFPPNHPPMKHLLGCPIKFDERLIGTLYLADRDDGEPFSEDDQAAVQALSAACAVALTNVQSMERLRRLNDELEAQVAERTAELQASNSRLRSHEVELEITNEELLRANEAKNQFLANTSHELRTPLNAIIGFSELITNPRMGELTDKQRRYIDNIHTSGKRLLGIINALLDISRIEAGMMVIDEQLFQPREVLEQVIGEMKPLAKAKGLNLAVEGGDIDALMRSDRGKVHQMMVNLLGNAIKFTPEGGDVAVSLQLRKRPDGMQVLQVQVKDSGIGISAEEMERIFEPFVQAQGGLSRDFEGTGLGLALTRKLARMLGGDVCGDSEQGVGSCFTIELPFEEVEAASQRKVEVAEDQPAGRPALKSVEVMEVVPREGPKPRVIIVDSLPERGMAVARSLEEEGGYEAVECPDIQSVLQAAAERPPFLVMMGISQHGEQTLHELQELKSHRRMHDVPVFLIGGTVEAPEFSVGEIDMFAKSMSRREMIDVITRYGRQAPLRPQVPTVLIIDDDASVRELLQELLVHEGYRILLASNGEDGVAMAIEREPDLIILDLMMAGMNGFDVMNTLRRNPLVADIPVLIFTAMDMSREELLKLGQHADRVLIKGEGSHSEIMRQLRRLELLYPLHAHMIDATLDCFNQRYMRLRMNQEVANGLRHKLVFSILGWEMDQYEAYVEQHGERWAIAALKEMVETVKGVTRRADVFARISENRFEVFLSNTTPGGAARVAEKLRVRIQHQRFPLPQPLVGSFTASFGAVHFPVDSEDPAELLQLLEQRIDEACQRGGNHCVVGDI